jgi:hypothetical protein
MRKDKQQRLDRFTRLIADIIQAGDPITMKLFEGMTWAAMSQRTWCEALGFSGRTLRELARCCPPIVMTKTTNEDGKPLVLYRLGSEPHKSTRHVANIMASMYRQQYGVERISRRAWGCLNGLAEVWPDGVQVDIFRMLLADVGAFMAAVKSVDSDCPYSMRYYEWLAIPLVRKYHHIALQLYIQRIQEMGKKPHPSIHALLPKLWPTKGLIG